MFGPKEAVFLLLPCTQGHCRVPEGPKNLLDCRRNLGVQIWVEYHAQDGCATTILRITTKSTSARVQNCTVFVQSPRTLCRFSFVSILEKEIQLPFEIASEFDVRQSASLHNFAQSFVKFRHPPCSFSAKPRFNMEESCESNVQNLFDVG